MEVRWIGATGYAGGNRTWKKGQEVQKRNEGKKEIVKTWRGLTELQSWIGRWNNDGMADGIEMETDRCNYAG